MKSIQIFNFRHFRVFQKIMGFRKLWQERCCILTKSWQIFNLEPDLEMVLDSTMRFRTNRCDLSPKYWPIVPSKLTKGWKLKLKIQRILFTYKLKICRFAEYSVLVHELQGSSKLWQRGIRSSLAFASDLRKSDWSNNAAICSILLTFSRPKKWRFSQIHKNPESTSKDLYFDSYLFGLSIKTCW